MRRRNQLDAATDECSRVTTPQSTKTRVGILPKGRAMGKRKLIELLDQSPHALHSFSTGLLAAEFAEMFT